MIMSSPGFSIICLAVAGSIVMPCAVYHHEQLRLHGQNQSLKKQGERLTELSLENQRLSDLVSKTGIASTSNDEVRELLRLRGEIGQLRQTVAEIDRLRLQNEQLTATNSTSVGQPRTSSPPDPQVVLAYWPKDQLAAVGYADPASALETALQAVSRGDSDALLASVTPEAKSKLTRENWFIHGTAADEVAAAIKQMARSLDPSTGFYVVGQTFVSPDQAILDVYFDGEGKTRKVSLQKIGDAWKFNTLGKGAWP
jgi:hypothetical protein